MSRDETTGRYGVKYTELIAPIIKAIQELYIEVFDIKTDVAALMIENADQSRSIASKVDRAEIDVILRAKDQEIKKLNRENAAIKDYRSVLP